MPPPSRHGRKPTLNVRQRTPGHHYNASFLPAADRAEILTWLATLHPLWEERYSKHFPPPPGQTQRRLLRPVYWLGNWQFACLDYYRPPQGGEGPLRAGRALPSGAPAAGGRRSRRWRARMFRGAGHARAAGTSTRAW